MTVDGDADKRNALEDAVYRPLRAAGAPSTPDWRWRYFMDRIDRLEAARGPEEFFSDADGVEPLNDPITIECVFPYLRFRLGRIEREALPDDIVVAMGEAMEAASEWAMTRHAWSLRLEAGIMAGRPVGETIPEDGNMSRLGQIVYERLFFDVRPWLDDPRICAALVCSDVRRLLDRGMGDFICKAIAYGLGFSELENWLSRKPSSAASAIARDIEYAHLYLDGLRLLGLDRHEDVSAVLCQRLAAVGLARSGGESGVGRDRGRQIPRYDRERIEGLLEMIPKEMTMKKA